MKGLVVLFLWAVSAAKLKEWKHDLPAYMTAANGGTTSHGEQMPLPHFKHRIGIQYWGGWEVVMLTLESRCLWVVLSSITSLFSVNTRTVDANF